MDDRFLYFSNWLHGDLRQYDVSRSHQPAADGPALARRAARQAERQPVTSLSGGPQMIQLSLDGRRLYVTNSLYSSWDNQFYPGCARGSCGSTARPTGGMEVDPDFFVDFHDRPDGPARAHEVRLEGGDCTTEIFQ